MELNRRRTRVIVDINVTLTTVLDSIDARIIDLSEHGAQIVGAALSEGSKFQIEYMGQTVFAQCIWSEVDRMGVRFPFSMAVGPLHDILMLASPEGTIGMSGPDSAEQDDLAHYAMGRPARRPIGSFGRRSMN
ncbi:MAG: PilZ domain-containing protein [Sphingobium sp.]